MVTEKEKIQLISLLSYMFRDIVKDLENKDIESFKKKLEDHTSDFHKVDLHIALPSGFKKLGYESFSQIFCAICDEPCYYGDN